MDKITWTMVQSKMKKEDKIKVTVDDEIPLRGVVKCHCGTPLTGAPSVANLENTSTIINASIQSITI